MIATCLPEMRGNKGGAQRHLGLAEADVAAHQAVHRPPVGEIDDDFCDGALLVLGLGIGEAGAEFVEQALRRLQHVGGLDLAQRRGLHQLGGDVADALLDPALRACQAAPPILSSATMVSSPP